MTRPSRPAFTIMEVMVSIAILALLTSALLTFSFGLGARRDRLVREGDRGATLARVMDRLERLAATSRRGAATGRDWLEVEGRGVWPEAGPAGVPPGPIDCTGRLSFDAESGALVWTERSAAGSSYELVVTDVQAVLVDRFDDLVTSAGAAPPVRLSLWLAPVDAGPAAEVAPADAPGAADELDALDPMALFEAQADLPARPADAVYVVAPSLGGADLGEAAPDAQAPDADFFDAPSGGWP